MIDIPSQLINYIKRNGKKYKPALCPKEIPRGRIGDCFDHCALIAAKSRDRYRYVEGYAKDPISSHFILHAWLTDAEGKNAYDPTWRAENARGEEVPVPTIYRGMQVDLDDLVRFLIRTAHKSIIANAWRSPRLAQAAMPGLPIIKP